MKITATHSTRYRYDPPVSLEPHIFRLRPRSNSTQHLLDFDIQITPMPAGTTECLDQDGTLALNAWFNAPVAELVIETRFTVEIDCRNPFDYILTNDSLRMPLFYPEPLATALGPYRNQQHIADPVRQYATSTAAGAGDTLSFLTALARRINEEFRQVIRPEGAPWVSEQTLRAREGSCRDLAVLFCDACRVMGMAARFVSGYECASAMSDEPSMHAWAEVYLPGVGWRGYDPARGMAVCERHVAVAAGFDAGLAAPVAGWFSGQSRSSMEASLHLEVDEAA